MIERTRHTLNRRGTALIIALTFLSVLLLATSAFVSNVIFSSNVEAMLERRTKCFYIAEAGINHAMWKLGREGGRYSGEKGVRFGEGSFDVEVGDYSKDPGKKLVVSRARLEGHRAGGYVEQVRVVVDLRPDKEGQVKARMVSWDSIE